MLYTGVTVHTHILVGRFHARMKICLHEYAKGAPRDEQKELRSSGEPRSGGFANGAE